LRTHARWLFALALAVAGCGGATPERDASESGVAPITADAVRAHVQALASPEFDGRLTGTEGERLATEYVARQFESAGLAPGAPDGTWFQPFEFTAGTSLGATNDLRRSEGDPYSVDRDWRPLAFSRTGDAKDTPVAFAGYGIVAPAGDGVAAYDSYAGLDVRGKLVLVLRYAPQDVGPEQRQHLMRYASLRHKAMLARDHGAVGVLIATGPRSPVREQLVALRNDAAVGATSVFALSLTDAVAASWLKETRRELDDVQRELDGGAPSPGFELPYLKLDLRVDLVQERRSGRNAIGRLRTKQSAATEPVLVGAHVDHLGRADGASSLARDEERGQVHPGADDNASGVAALIEIARQLAAEEHAYPGSFARDVLFAAWSGEEIGLIGSAAYARDYPDAVALAHGAARPLAAALNLDMVGRLRDRLTIQGSGSSPIWDGLVARANAPLALPVLLQPDSYLPTDSTSFHLKGIPVLSFFTGGHAEYHTPRDTADTLNYPGLASVAELVASVTAEVAEETELPERLAPAKPEVLEPRAGLRAYLGTIPSYGESETGGVTLSGVAPGGPAERAGVRGGDRILELAGHAIENIYDYTYALDAVTIGKPVPIVVEREGKRLTLTITPASRD
jgi:hypothetical protein